LDDGSGSIRLRPLLVIGLAVLICTAFTAVNENLRHPSHDQGSRVWAATEGAAEPLSMGTGLSAAIRENLSPGVVLTLVILLALSAFFSASEAAFTSIHQVRLRGMREEGGFLGRMVAKLMQHPVRLLITILIGNMIVNVLISIILPLRLGHIIETGFRFHPALSYILTISVSTLILVFFGEITPKIFAVRIDELFARAAAIPLQGVDWVLTPARVSAIKFTEFLFRVTRIDRIQPAPFITDKEFFTVLSDSEAQGVIEQEEGQMIQGIIESGDAYLREILVPRPDVVSISSEASVREARELFRKREFSRMPVHEDNLDHIVGVLVVKDLLQHLTEDSLDKPIGPLARPASFVPETMTVREFVKDAQRKRMHMSIVVDEYGGTEGIATLEDAIEEVVGDIRDEEDEDPEQYRRQPDGSLVVDGRLPLDDLCDLIGVKLEDDEHQTVAGFFMDHTNKIPENGDRLVQNGLVFTVDRVDGKRTSSLHVQVSDADEKEQTG